MSVAEMCFSFQGRMRRMHYWGATILVTVVLFAVLFAIDVWLPQDENGQPSVAGATLVAIVYFVGLWTSLAIQVKRWHDRDKAGWWVLINLVPILGTLWAFVENGFLDGTPGPNRFGPSPKGFGEVGPV
jgi:uncharacterized membrane protein YhaH (DUF805 family)